MASSSRTKGHSFERSIVKSINQALGRADLQYCVSRNLDQTRDGGSDIKGLENFQIECKRYKRNNSDIPRKDWWRQVLDACKANNDVPILIYKYDYQDVQAQFPVMLFNFVFDEVDSYDEMFSEYPARMNFDEFLYLLIVYLKAIQQ